MSTRKAQERAVAFIVVRLNSSRLPGKQLRAIGPRPLLAWTTAALKQARLLDAIVVATTTEACNDPLVAFAAQEKIGVFRYAGDPNHVTTRLAQAGEDAGADIALLVSGDCPLIPPKAVDLLIGALQAHPDWDSVLFQADDSGLRPVIEGLGAYRLRAWHKADLLSDRPELKEHHFPVIHQQGQQDFVIGRIPPPAEFCAPCHRVSVDTWADFEFINAVYERLQTLGRPFDLEKVLHLLADEPGLCALNRHVHQRRLEEKSRRVLAVVDHGAGFGSGHLVRSRELALRMTESLGWQVVFLTNDQVAVKMLDEVGLSTCAASPVSDPVAAFFEAPASFLSGFDAVFIDIAASRNPTTGWRRAILPPIFCVVLDCVAAWSDEADLVVVPGVVCPEKDEKNRSAARLHCGRGFVILRREIRALAVSPPAKDIDILSYFTNRPRNEKIRHAAQSLGLSCVTVEGDEKDFPRLLARSRVYVSGFGVSCYEALTLASVPVVWPHSARHRQDAAAFYAALSLPALLVDEERSIPSTLDAARGLRTALPRLCDGTDNIVALFAALGEKK